MIRFFFGMDRIKMCFKEFVFWRHDDHRKHVFGKEMLNCFAEVVRFGNKLVPWKVLLSEAFVHHDASLADNKFAFLHWGISGSYVTETTDKGSHGRLTFRPLPFVKSIGWTWEMPKTSSATIWLMLLVQTASCVSISGQSDTLTMCPKDVLWPQRDKRLLLVSSLFLSVSASRSCTISGLISASTAATF